MNKLPCIFPQIRCRPAVPPRVCIYMFACVLWCAYTGIDALHVSVKSRDHDHSDTALCHSGHSSNQVNFPRIKPSFLRSSHLHLDQSSHPSSNHVTLPQIMLPFLKSCHFFLKFKSPFLKSRHPSSNQVTLPHIMTPFIKSSHPSSNHATLPEIEPSFLKSSHPASTSSNYVTLTQLDPGRPAGQPHRVHGRCLCLQPHHI